MKSTITWWDTSSSFRSFLAQNSSRNTCTKWQNRTSLNFMMSWCTRSTTKTTFFANMVPLETASILYCREKFQCVSQKMLSWRSTQHGNCSITCWMSSSRFMQLKIHTLRSVSSSLGYSTQLCSDLSTSSMSKNWTNFFSRWHSRSKRLMRCTQRWTGRKFLPKSQDFWHSYRNLGSKPSAIRRLKKTRFFAKFLWCNKSLCLEAETVSDKTLWFQSRPETPPVLSHLKVLFLQSLQKTTFSEC